PLHRGRQAGRFLQKTEIAVAGPFQNDAVAIRATPEGAWRRNQICGPVESRRQVLRQLVNDSKPIRQTILTDPLPGRSRCETLPLLQRVKIARMAVEDDIA